MRQIIDDFSNNTLTNILQHSEVRSTKEMRRNTTKISNTDQIKKEDLMMDSVPEHNEIIEQL